MSDGRSVRSAMTLWLKEEGDRESRFFLPRSARDEIAPEEEDDPHRIVLFDDIRDFIFEFNDPRILVLSFVSFLGIPVLPGSQDHVNEDFKPWLYEDLSLEEKFHLFLQDFPIKLPSMLEQVSVAGGPQSGWNPFLASVWGFKAPILERLSTEVLTFAR